MKQHLHNHGYHTPQVQQGLSLVELMISITIGLLILAAMTTLFSNQSRTRSEMVKSNRMIDNGRYALDVLTENLRMAGFYDSYEPTGGTPTASPDPCDISLITNTATNQNVLLHHVQGFDAADSVSPANLSLAPTCGFTYTAANALSLKAGSDILVVRRTNSISVAAASAVAAPNSDNTVYFQLSNCTTDLPLVYLLDIGSSTTFANYHDKDCTASAHLRPFIVQVYFVSPDNDIGDGIPTLKRRELDQATGTFVTKALVEGIEYMQVDYGLDSNADGAPDSYISAPTLADWPNIVSIKINILARNTETTTGYIDTKSYALGAAGTFGPFNDRYKRHVYTQVVRLVNPAGRRGG